MPGIRITHACILTLLFAACSDDNYNPCPNGVSLCDYKCVDFETDDDHCGKCDNQCGPHSDCYDGVCNCIVDYADCDGEQATGCEVRTDDDPEHCGGCGHPCPAGFTCCDGWCVDLYKDEHHCGSCDTTCQADEYCEGANCIKIDKCEDLGFTICNNECVDLSNNFHHCGSCNSTCGEFQYCENGQCECFSGLENCDGVCKDIISDDDNCGECGNQCASNQFCDQGQCANMESSQLGDPCPFGTVNVTANYCVAGLECLGTPANGNAGTCSGGEPSECFNLLPEWNPDCVSGNCGASFCSHECTCSYECPEGYDPANVGYPAKCMCIPGYPGSRCRGGCRWGDVNSGCYDCGSGMACLGNDDVGACPGGCDSECNFIPENYNPDCVDRVCGFSFCAPECDALGECPQEYQPADVSGNCYCIPYNPGIGQDGDPCPYGDFNATADQCSALLTCIGHDDAGSCPGGTPADCGILDNRNPECIDGICGFSFCARRCGATGYCPLGFTSGLAEGTCYCVPIPPGDAQAGDPCTFGHVNITHDDCAVGLTCLGLEADGDSGECPGGNPAECTEYPATWNPDCINGHCGFSYCAEECDAQGTCQAGYEPQVVNATCYCAPAD